MQNPQNATSLPSLDKVKKSFGKSWLAWLVGVGTGLFIFFFVFYKLPNPYSLKDYKAVPLSTHIYDRKGRLLYEIYKEENRSPIKLKNLPSYVAQATIAIEDKDFYHHRGVSLFGGIFRALKDTILKQRLQGGSTITQQLIKSALLSPERTIRRKIREIILALWTERIFTKNEILELYLNQVPYGGSSYGIEVASKTYFGKRAKDLKLHEAAFLAGLPQAPSLYSPYNNPALALRRRNEVLGKMLKQRYIDKTLYDKAAKEKLAVKPPTTDIKAPHFVFYVKSELERFFGAKTVEEGGLRVITTLDLDIQQEAEKVLGDELEKVKNLNVSNGAVLVTRPPTGEILTMVGSVDYFASPSGAFNVTTALRQPGSAIKPINYAIGLERKLVTPATIFLDVQTCFNPPGQPKAYCPVNYDGRYHGPVPLRFALGSSYNIPAVKMLAINGVREFVASAGAFLITSFKDPARYGLSLTLGGGEVRMTEMAQAFSSFPNRGTPKRAISILKVQDKSGKVLFEFEDPNFVKDVRKPLKYPRFFAIKGKKAISAEAAFLISHILVDNFARSPAFGASSQLVIPGKSVSVKTGTTDDKKDNWTIGYTPNFLTTVWVGNNDNTPMNPYLTSGVTGAAPIWNRVMRYVLEGQPNLLPIRPSTVVTRQVCWTTGTPEQKKEGEPQEGGGCQTRLEYFIKGTETKTLAGNIKTERKAVAVTKDSDKLVRNPQEGDPNVEIKEKTIVTDGISTYCMDCAGDQPTTPTPAP
ncbi:penicillin-binding protein [Candidatus Roizmanbacteria bacterium]|nr:penicillin-binding protein [Candidatus Roizmanbacteria bacterium]